jgi:acyl dehydratase
MTNITASTGAEFRYHAGFEYPEWDFEVTAETQARKLACCDINPAIYGDRVDITHYALATVLSAKRAGLPVNGRVHMTQRFDQSEPIMVGETLTVRGRDIEVAPDRRGQIVTSRFEFVRSDGSIPLRAERTSIVLDATLAEKAQPSEAKSKPAADPTEGMIKIGEKQLVPEKVAAYSDEAENLIHSDPDTARRFGFRAPIAAGLMAIRFMMEALSKEAVPDRLDLQIRFRRPMFWDEKLDIWGRHDDGKLTHIAIVNQDGKLANDCVIDRVEY